MPQRRAKGEGNIGRRKEGGLWYGRIDVGRAAAGKRRSRTAYSRTRAGAAAKLQALLLEQQRLGLPVAADQATVAASLDEWLVDAVRPAVRLRTHESYAQLVRVYIAPAIGHHQLRRLEPSHVQDLLNELPDIRFHDLRHACASLLFAAGHHPRVVMDAPGHSQIAVTMDTYAHVYSGTPSAVADTMESLLSDTLPGAADGVPQRHEQSTG